VSGFGRSSATRSGCSQRFTKCKPSLSDDPGGGGVFHPPRGFDATRGRAGREPLTLQAGSNVRIHRSDGRLGTARNGPSRPTSSSRCMRPPRGRSR
jgi:hypothetical protein